MSGAKISANGKKMSVMSISEVMTYAKSEKGRKQAKALKELEKRGLKIE